MKYIKKFFLLFFLTSSSCLFANNSKIEFLIQPYFSIKFGSQNEDLYYSSGYKCSNLKWEEKPITSAGINLLFSLYKFGIDCFCEFAIPSQCGKMFDSDWIYTSDYPEGLKTTYSIHENSIKSNFFTKFDFFYTFNITKSLSILPKLSFSFEHYKFEARNGYGYYGKAEHSLNHENVSFDSEFAKFYPNLYGINLERNYYILWTGVSINFDIKKISLKSNFLISPFSYSTSKNFHYGNSNGFYTNTYIKNYFTNYKINIDIIYKITKKFNIRLGTDFIYMYSKKDTIYSDYHGIMAETNQKGCGNNTSIKINLGCLFKIK